MKPQQLRIIADLTIREMVQGQFMWAGGGLFLLFFLFLSCISWFRPDEQMKIMSDLGCAFFSFAAGLCVFVGTPLLFSGAHRTAGDGLFLAKPIGRGTFVCGKIVGVLSVFSALAASMAAVFCGVLLIQVGAIPQELPAILYVLFLKYVLFGSVMVLLSVLFSPLISYCLGLTIFFFSTSCRYFSCIFQDSAQPVLAQFLNVCSVVLPRFDLYSLPDTIMLGKMVSIDYLGGVTVYTAVYTTLVIMITVQVYSRRQR